MALTIGSTVTRPNFKTIMTSLVTNFKQFLDIDALRSFKTQFLSEQNNKYLPYIVAATCCCLVYFGIASNNSSNKNKKKKRPKKKTGKSKGRASSVQKSTPKTTPAPPKPKKTSAEEIQEVNVKFNKEYREGIVQLLESYDPAVEEDTYKKKFYGEMLLKLLIELDGVDLISMEEGEAKNALKTKRKQSIKEIQSYLRKVDAL
ncbi:hypothetical protein ACO0RG_001534 [Hanseniaspora osmophila]|uniref:HSP70 co-chaperone SNL1 n=1 Tax=Hanseniaspora osmophila TaxID=56408 RepID=A0A1E5R0M8_9ASCO|nr:HSP70 co-chaperone SNL1 [Hanseniaspora osmophila]